MAVSERLLNRRLIQVSAICANFQNLQNDLGLGSDKSLLNRSLVLLLGAGVNQSQLPGWTELLKRVFKRASRRDLWNELPKDMDWFINSTKITSYEKAAFMRRLLQDYYLVALHEELYKPPSENKHGETDDSLLRTIAQLCQRETVRAVVTFNYDNLLEQFMEKDEGGRRAAPISGKRPGIPLSGEILPVYHIHGYLPQHTQPPTAEEAQVVFAEDEYYDFALEPFAWQTATMLHLMRSNTCLWIGASLSDMNMRKHAHHAIAYAGETHAYALMASEDFDLDNTLTEAEEQTKAIRVYASQLDNIGIRMIHSGQKHESKTARLTELNKMLRESDDEQQKK